MAIALKDTPRFEDQLVTYQNQKLWWLLIGASVLLCAALTVIAVQALRPGPPPYVLEINKATGEPIGAVAPVLGTQIIPDPAIRWELKEFIEYAFRVDKDFDEEKAAAPPCLRHSKRRRCSSGESDEGAYRAGRSRSGAINGKASAGLSPACITLDSNCASDSSSLFRNARSSRSISATV